MPDVNIVTSSRRLSTLKGQPRSARGKRSANPMAILQGSTGSTTSDVPSHRYSESTHGCNLHDALANARYPLQVRIPEDKDQVVFLGNPRERNTHTIIGNIRVDRVKCLGSSDQYVYLPLDIPKPVLFTQIDKNVDLASVLDVIKYKAKQRLSWLVVTKRFDYKSHTYEAGDILEVEKMTLSKRIVHRLLKPRWKEQLSVISHPNRCKRTLPSYLEGNFKKCRTPYSSCYSLLSDLMASKETPFLITLPREVTDSLKGSHNKAGQRLVALEQVSHNIIFMTDENDDIIVQAIPVNIDVYVEIMNNSPTNQRETVNFNKYRERLISNLARLECCPVYMRDLFPEICLGEQELNVNVAVNTRMRTHNIVVSVKSDSWVDLAKPIPMRRSMRSRTSCSTNFKPAADFSFDIENHMDSSDLYSSPTESPPLYRSSPIDSCEGDYLQPLPSTDTSVCTIYTGIDERKDGSLRSVRVGRDGYVIVPPFASVDTFTGEDTLDSRNHTLIQTLSLSDHTKLLERESLLSTKLDLLYEAKFGSPPKGRITNNCLTSKPVPNPRPPISSKPERTKPVPPPRKYSKYKRTDSKFAGN